jgi:hypothetical protein
MLMSVAAPGLQALGELQPLQVPQPAASCLLGACFRGTHAAYSVLPFLHQTQLSVLLVWLLTLLLMLLRLLVVPC